MNIDFLVLGILHGVRGEFVDDVSEAAVSPIFTGHESECKWASHSVAHLRSDSWPVKIGLTAAPETSLGNSPFTQWKIPKTKN